MRQTAGIRIEVHLSESVAPFLRWAGSKRWLSPHLAKLVTVSDGDYYEPFLGSGAAFFSIAPSGNAYLSDTLAPLIACFNAVRDTPIEVDHLASSWPTDTDTYYQIRSQIFHESALSAAQFIYLNKLCFNGLYRENQKGQFNVPYGRPKSSTVLLPGHLEAASRRLSNATIEHLDFEASLERCKPGDLVYIDPPYVARHRSNGFVDYNAKIFSWHDQGRLASVFRLLSERGVRAIVSNADHESIRDLYAGFEIRQLERYSSMSGKSGNRGASPELLILAEAFDGSAR